MRIPCPGLLPPALAAAVLLATSGCTAAARATGKQATLRPLPGAAEAGAPTTTVLLAPTSSTTTGEAIAWPSPATATISSREVTIAPGQTTGWHRHPGVVFGRVLSGELEVEYAGRGRRVLHAGERIVESQQVAHTGTNLGAEPVRILVVAVGPEGKSMSVKTQPPSMPTGLGGTRAADLVEATAVDPRLRVDLRYAGTDNFTGRVLYPVSRALLQRPAAEALRRANDRAHAEGRGLLVLDAYRPWSVTRMFWDAYPMHRAYLADPQEGSRHNRGCAVDLTVVDLATGKEVRMPSGYDDFSERAHPGWQGGSAAERAERDRLRGWMEAEGFTVHPNEWWHFDHAGWEQYPVMDVPLEETRPAAVSGPARGGPAASR